MLRYPIWKCPRKVGGKKVWQIVQTKTIQINILMINNLLAGLFIYQDFLPNAQKE